MLTRFPLQRFMHDGRCLTLEDPVEDLNLIQRLHRTAPEKMDLASFLLCLYGTLLASA